MWTRQPSADPTPTPPPQTTSTPPSTTTSPDPSGPSIPFEDARWIGLALLVGLLIGGLILILAQANAPRKDRSGSVVRAWIALSLIFGLLAFSLLTFILDDQDLRTTALGGLTASVGAAIAFYFSARSSEDARKDMLDLHKQSAVITEIVPDLTGMTSDTASFTLGKTTFKLEFNPAHAPSNTNDVVTSQNPTQGSQVAQGSTITVSFG
jgi:hypothetical protein